MNDAFAHFIGIELLEVSPGQAKARLDITERHFNGLGSVHGGAMFTLADCVFAAAANAYDKLALAIHVDISYLKAATGGTLFAEAREISRNPKLATYTVNVTTANGELIALFQGMAYRKEKIS